VAKIYATGGSVYCWPARETYSVHCWPSQYRISKRPDGSGYQPAGVVTTGAGAGVGAAGAGAGDGAPGAPAGALDAPPGPVPPGPAAPGVVVAPPIGAIGSDDAGLDGDDGVVAVDEEEFDHGDGAEPAPGAPDEGVVTEGVVATGAVTDGVLTDGEETDGDETDGVLTDGVETDGVDGLLDDGTSGETAQPDGSFTGSGVRVAALAAGASPTSASGPSCVEAPTVDSGLSAALSSLDAGLSSWEVPAPAARLPKPPATGAASFLSLSDVAASSSSDGSSRLKNAVTSPPVGMIVTMSQPSADRSLSLPMRPSTS
jgi:hypothetical protein